MSRSRVLFIDAYDSFSNNIITLLQQELCIDIETIKINDNRFVLNDDAFFDFLHDFDAVVAGPGPGHPGNQEDVGLIKLLWTLPKKHILPVLGICLGFQSLCLSQGAKICRLREPRHGIVTPITHNSEGIFVEAKDVLTTQYHSLHAQLSDPQESLDTCQLWQVHPMCETLLPLAWDLSDSDNGSILMAVQHCTKPFTGMQFHPESICTNAEGRRLVRNWWQGARAWNHAHRHDRPWEHLDEHPLSARWPAREKQLVLTPSIVQFRKCSVPMAFDVIQLTSDLRTSCSPYEPVLLQSGLVQGAPINPETGRYSVIGVHDEHSVHIQYSCDRHELMIGPLHSPTTQKEANITDAYRALEEIVRSRRAAEGPDTPFWGGPLGFTSYEAGLESLAVQPSKPICQSVDLWFVFVERSIVVDHTDHSAYVQSIRLDDDDWLNLMVQQLIAASRPTGVHDSLPSQSMKVLAYPAREEYCKKVSQCQSHLRAGSSYELCLTDQTLIESHIDAWTLYERLSKLNPAPFGSFIRFHGNKDCSGVAIVGSSPERFLNWSRHGRCQFRPIKGTVPRTPGSDKADAEIILMSKKEQAENLMIVDLIRHDLAGVPGVSNVQVSSLMAIEEYATVFQLVSVIEGDMAPGHSGLNVLAASLPPGSMTGAPKRRSCELLRQLEQDQPRSIYSGVIGYLDVGGGGDFSVVIRTAFKWDTEAAWRVGAGGAVTVLSTPEAEYEEMITKRERLMAAFSQPSS